MGQNHKKVTRGTALMSHLRLTKILSSYFSKKSLCPSAPTHRTPGTLSDPIDWFSVWTRCQGLFHWKGTEMRHRCPSGLQKANPFPLFAHFTAAREVFLESVCNFALRNRFLNVVGMETCTQNTAYLDLELLNSE